VRDGGPRGLARGRHGDEVRLLRRRTTRLGARRLGDARQAGDDLDAVEVLALASW
jgi:hypothetical protein